MKKTILISAYACEPEKGSEPEVGWRWMLAKVLEFDEVVVATRKNNKSNIEEKLKYIDLNNVRFEYFDLPRKFSFWKNKNRGIQLYAYLWEVGLFLFLLNKYKKGEFSHSQRITFVSYKYPSFIWYFSKYFTLGPISGGESFPIDFLRIFTIKGKIREIFRWFFQRIILFDPFILLTLWKADKIIAVTQETKLILPKYIQKKTIIQPAISIEKDDFHISKVKRTGTILKLLYVGRLIECKGLILILKALIGVKDKINYEFNIIGEGTDKKRLERFVSSNRLKVNFLGKKKRSDLSNYYLGHSLLVFPSLHDSGGMVVLEAKLHNLKVLVSKFGGPKYFIDEQDILIQENSVDAFVANVVECLLKLNSEIRD